MTMWRAMTAIAVAALPAAAPAQTVWDKPNTTFHVSPDGDDKAAGSAAAPFRSLERAQAAVRAANAHQDVTVIVHGGVWTRIEPLIFTAKDGGQNGFGVRWRGADDARPLITSGIAVTGWTVQDKTRGIYAADVPKGTSARQLWVDGKLARRARTRIDRGDARFDARGISFTGAGADIVAQAAGERHVDVEATGFFTHRFSPVERIVGARLDMRQPAWNNNIWGYDTIPDPFHPEGARLYVSNALAFLDEEGEWYLDPEAGKLYYKPAAGMDMAKADVRLPRLPVLVSVSGTAQHPIRDLTLSGFRFSHTSWTGPSLDGYANQQSGTFITGQSKAFPADPLRTCRQGCPEFENERNVWRQMPAAVQVSAAQHVTISGNVFAHLGQYALGVGMDANANVSGVGLATVDVTVRDNLFADLSGGAIVAGGVRPDAHHPSDPALTNRQLMIRGNLIQGVGRDYTDNAAVLATYWDGSVIIHNDISDAPYDGIDIGFGWGYVDQGGNPNYRARQRGYDSGVNRVWDTPTIRRDAIVAFNRLYKVKQVADDGGAIYNLSACQDCVIAENHIFDIGPRVALYLDEGSRGFTVRDNVVEGGVRQWLNVNTASAFQPGRTNSMNNVARGNWHEAVNVGGIWNDYMNNRIEDDHVVLFDSWPGGALHVMGHAGLEAESKVPSYLDYKPRPKLGLPAPLPNGRGTYGRNNPKTAPKPAGE
ncbi:pectate lyase [Sphingopyxis sp. GW247-27LB]|uniref:pectate lyase n=1 Tax=Sphingopyxis sp. GW247-27LB TaxID=2012632 RepID=UPI000BA751E8|nr:pectate lyase [Sphingopyxis sp. GW247-27LB]PAL25082.1 pectate lyase [Sphingopyxis sp. GW247-27LB]